MFARARQLLGTMILATVLLTGCGQQGPANTTPTLSNGGLGTPAKGGLTQFYTRNVVYRVDEDVVVGMPDLVADIQVRQPNQPFIPANADDWVVVIHTGSLTMDDASMTAIFNKFVFNYPGSPLTNLKLHNKDGKVTMEATLHKGLPIPVYVEGTLVPNGLGQLVMKADLVKSAGVPVQGIMKVLGLEMASLINSKATGVKIDGNDIVIYPDKLLPPPAITGFAAGAKVENGRVTMYFDDKVRRPMPELPEPNAKNWLLMWGGNVLINNHLILDAKLMEIDMTPSSPMYLYMPAYREQLAAGFVVADHGYTITYVPDVVGTTIDLPRYRPKL